MKEEIIRLLNKLSDRDLRGILYVLQTLTKEEVQHESGNHLRGKKIDPLRVDPSVSREIQKG